MRDEVPWRTQLASARKLPDEFLRCRMLRHGPWKPHDPTPDELKRHSWGHALGWKCGSCGMVRIEVIDGNGGISWRKYNAPEGYGIEKGKTPSVRALRLEWIKRKKKNRRLQGREVA